MIGCSPEDIVISQSIVTLWGCAGNLYGKGAYRQRKTKVGGHECTATGAESSLFRVTNNNRAIEYRKRLTPEA